MTKTEIITSKNSSRASRHSKIYAHKNITHFRKFVDNPSTSCVSTDYPKLSSKLFQQTCSNRNGDKKLFHNLVAACRGNCFKL